MRKIRSTFLRFISNWESDFLVILQNAPRLPNMNRMVFSLISEKSLPRSFFPPLAIYENTTSILPMPIPRGAPLHAPRARSSSEEA